MKRLFSLFAALAFISACTSTTSQQASDSYQKILDDAWEYQMSSSPTWASSMGDRRWNDQLSDISPKGMKLSRDRARGLVERIDALQVSDQDQEINLALLKRSLQETVDQFDFNAHYMPLTSEWGFHASMSSLARSSLFESKQDYHDYMSRMKKVPAYFDQQMAWMRKGIETGITQPQEVLQGFEQTIAAYITEKVEDNSFYSPFKSKPDFIDDAEWNKLVAEAKSVVKNDILGSYQKYYDFFVNEYYPSARKTIALSDTPNGRAYYENRVRYYTTLDITSEEVHNIGLKEVARIRSEMQDIIEELKFEGDFADFVKFLRTDPQFYAKTPEELLKEASFIAKKMDAKLPSLFKKMPRTPYGVAPVPEQIAPKYTTGRYVGPSRDDQPGYYWVNTYALDRRPLYVLEALTLHEAVPGHHFQISLTREMENMPEFRKHSYISAFGEGWGLYSEYLGIEAGFYQTPYTRFGRLTYEMWRACRLVVDTGMHVKGWSRQQAIDYMANNSALSMHNIKTETDRYISWGGQALSYKMGEITIKRLRKKAEKELGHKFDLRDFHDAILENGSVTLSMLEQQVDRFIKATQ